MRTQSHESNHSIVAVYLQPTLYHQYLDGFDNIEWMYFYPCQVAPFHLQLLFGQIVSRHNIWIENTYTCKIGNHHYQSCKSKVI